MSLDELMKKKEELMKKTVYKLNLYGEKYNEIVLALEEIERNIRQKINS